MCSKNSRFKMNLNIPVADQRVLDEWYSNFSAEALNRNYVAINNWTCYKADTENAKINLEWLPKKLSHNVMVPLGNKALMRGKIVHTNEFLVNLGDNWFVKRTANQTAEICDRRIKHCEDMLNQLNKERDLIEQRQKLSVSEVFGSEERPEIIEEVTEEEEKKWREEHHRKEKEYRQKLAELRKKEKTNVETEEDLWKRLDELEMIEELEDELERLHNEDSQDEDDDSEEENDEEGGVLDVLIDSSLKKNGIIQPTVSPETEISVQEDQHPGEHIEIATVDQIKTQESRTSSESVQIAKKEKPRTQVSFYESVEEEISNDEPLRLEIKHSCDEYVAPINMSDTINSPADIYEFHKKNVRKKSILKISKNPNQELETIAVQQLDELDEAQEFKKTDICPGVDLKDICERSNLIYDNKINIKEQPKKLSKFKMSRLKK